MNNSFIFSSTANHDANSPQDIPCSTLRIGLMINLLQHGFLMLSFFGCLYHVLPQCGLSFSTFRFVQAVLTLLVKLYEHFLSNIILYKKTVLSSVAHGFFINLTAEMVDDLKDARSNRPPPPVESSQ